MAELSKRLLSRFPKDPTVIDDGWTTNFAVERCDRLVGGCAQLLELLALAAVAAQGDFLTAKGAHELHPTDTTDRRSSAGNEERKMDYKPRNDYVLVQPDGAVTRRGKLHLPASAITVPSRGTVIAVGPGYIVNDGTRQKLDLEVGDRVQYLLGGDHMVVKDEHDEELFLMRETNILATVLNEPMPEMEGPEDDTPAPGTGG